MSQSPIHNRRSASPGPSGPQQPGAATRPLKRLAAALRRLYRTHMRPGAAAAHTVNTTWELPAGNLRELMVERSPGSSS